MPGMMNKISLVCPAQDGIVACQFHDERRHFRERFRTRVAECSATTGTPVPLTKKDRSVAPTISSSRKTASAFYPAGSGACGSGSTATNGSGADQVHQMYTCVHGQRPSVGSPSSMRQGRRTPTSPTFDAPS